jgi:hypothetical protein
MDLLSGIIPEANVDFTPRSFLVEPYTDQLGFLGFSSSNMLRNLNTMNWFILADLIWIVFMGSIYDSVSLCFLGKLGRFVVN